MNKLRKNGSLLIILKTFRKKSFFSSINYHYRQTYTDSILLNPEGPFQAPSYERKAEPKRIDVKKLPRFEQNIMINPYATLLQTPIRQCIYHERWFPTSFLVRFIKAYNEKTSTTWIVPDFADEGVKRPGKGFWIRCNSKILQLTTKEGKYKYIDNNAFWRPDMHEHVWNVLLDRTLSQWNKVLLYIGTKRFPHSKNIVFVPIIPIVKSKSTNFVEYKIGNEKLWINGINCVFILDPIKTQGDTIINNQQQHPHQLVQSKRNSISSTPISFIKKVSFYNRENNLISYNVTFYNVKDLFGNHELIRLRKFLKLNDNDNDVRMFGLVTFLSTKSLSMALWKLHLYLQDI
nr:14953_t:CDS:2 [Entrophospora candida]CAG8611078.1 5562_t:CDS:2 [Entrophospora candida]